VCTTNTEIVVMASEDTALVFEGRIPDDSLFRRFKRSLFLRCHMMTTQGGEGADGACALCFLWCGRGVALAYHL